MINPGWNASTTGSNQIMPVLFIGHGSPMNALEKNEFTDGWTRMAADIPRPDAILCISAHWETQGTNFTAMPKPQTIHDFGGFPRELYEVRYPAPGSPELAKDAQSMLEGLNPGLDTHWGLDHGCWVVLKYFYPAADIPVIQMSLDYTKTPKEHFEIARQLAALRRKGVLIIGSGNMVHNLGMIDWDRAAEPGYGYDWALEVNDKMKKSIFSGDYQPLINYQAQGRDFRLAIPTPEHFFPLLYILALKEDNEQISIFNDRAIMGSLTMTSVKIQPEFP